MGTYLDGLIVAHKIIKNGDITELESLIAQIQANQIETTAVYYDAERR